MRRFKRVEWDEYTIDMRINDIEWQLEAYDEMGLKKDQHWLDLWWDLWLLKQ